MARGYRCTTFRDGANDGQGPFAIVRCDVCGSDSYMVRTNETTLTSPPWWRDDGPRDVCPKHKENEAMTNEAKALHLWWNGYDHSVGATADEALRWFMAETGESEENCRGDDGWEQLPDDMVLLGEDGKPLIREDGQPTGETALDMAVVMVARRPIPEPTP